LNAFSKFSKSLAIATVALCAAVLLVSAWAPVEPAWAVAGVLLMALNTLGALGVLRLRLGVEPIHMILVSMLARLVIVAGVMLVVIRLVSHTPSLYSFVFSALGSYLVFQAVEIRHVLRNPGMLAK
jgi:hypothetical protein